MHPLLALALVMAAGIGLTRLSLPSVRVPAPLAAVLAAGAPCLLLGALLGPGLGALDRPTLAALAPATALLLGWLGAGLGARLEWRRLRRVPARTWARGAALAVPSLALTAVAAGLLRRGVPALAEAWWPAVPAVVTLAATAAGAAAARAARARAVALIATACGVLVFVVMLALFVPSPLPGRAPVARLLVHGLVTAGAGAGVAVLFWWLAWARAAPTELGLQLGGALLLGAGFGYAAGLSSFAIGALAAALIASRSPARREVRAVLDRWAFPFYGVFLVIAGAMLRLPTVWLLPVAVALAGLRLAARWLPARFALAQGTAALALAVSFELAFRGSGAVLMTVVIGVLVAAAAAGGAAWRSGPLTAAPPRAEVM